MTHSLASEPTIYGKPVNRPLLVLNSLVAVIYFAWWLIPGHVGNVVLYVLLVLGEAYHVGMALLFWRTVWPGPREPRITVGSKLDHVWPTVDVFIPVAGEPVEVIRQTAAAAKAMEGAHQVYILNDGRVAKKDNWQAVEELAQELDVHCLTRTQPGGAKAGNINQALRQTAGEVVVIFDADMVPAANFLTEVLPHFADERVGFVQTPQYYTNYGLNAITAGAWEQQEFFFGPIMQGKDRRGAAFICGTNVAIRRAALEQVGGMCEDNIAEDFLTSLFIHQRGWLSRYLPEVLAQGLAPEDLGSYYKQQLRWARGSLEVLFGQNPLFKPGLTWDQKLQYLASALYYLNGLVVLIDIVMPLLFLFFGWQPVMSTTTTFALFFVPFMFLNLYTLFDVSEGQLTFRAMSFSQSSWVLQLRALVSLLLRRNMAFAVTPKQAQKGNFLSLAIPHVAYAGLAVAGALWAVNRDGLNASVVTNVAWAFFNIVLFMPYIAAAAAWHQPEAKETEDKSPEALTPGQSPAEVEVNQSLSQPTTGGLDK